MDSRTDKVRRRAIDYVLAERLYQVQRWALDDQDKTPEDWLAALAVYNGKLAQELRMYRGPGFSLEKVLKRFIQVGAVSMAAIESVLSMIEEQAVKDP